MDEITFHTLLEKLDKTYTNLQKRSPDYGLVRSEDFTNLNITKELDVDMLTEEQMILLHTQLHMFYANGNGKGLKPRDIILLHKEVSKKLKNHQNFDKLDKKV